MKNGRSPRTLMLQGTGSDVGKTVLVAGLCRLARHRGLTVRPFKPQNMSNNAAVADVLLPDGTAGEIGRAQWLQALACNIPSSVHMNPVLLKPQSETGSQIIVHGKVQGTARGRDYQRLKPELMGAVMESWEHVCDGADLVIVEGAGSPAEINLRAGDIANMGFAQRAGVPVVLVGDIDRGGVIASLVGTHTILSPDDRQLIAGYLINKFRGDVSLFDDGLKAVHAFTRWPCFGVVPWLEEAGKLPAEDSVVLERISGGAEGGIKIAVPVCSRIANFDDFDPLIAEPGVSLVMVKRGDPLPEDAALIVLPGSKSTIADLLEFRELGWDRQLLAHVARGGRVLGICGGYQMLGQVVRDPQGIEGNTLEARGLGLLDVETVLVPSKTVRNVSAVDADTGKELSGYEIHMGVTEGADTQRPMIRIDGRADGAVSADGRVRGCYLHGLFGADEFRRHLIGDIGGSAQVPHYRASLEQALDDLAARLEDLVDPDIFDLSTGKTVV